MLGRQQMRRDADHREMPVYVTIDADNTGYKIPIGQFVTFFTTALADAAAIVYLPPVTESVGQSYYICAPTGATGGDISVYTREAGSEIDTYGDMDADDDHAIFYSDGKNWRVALNGVA